MLVWLCLLACCTWLLCLIQLKHGLRLRSASHVAHEEVPDTDEIGGPWLLKISPSAESVQGPIFKEHNAVFHAVPFGPSVETSGNHRGISDKAPVCQHSYKTFPKTSDGERERYSSVQLNWGKRNNNNGRECLSSVDMENLRSGGHMAW